ncbi:hypothetical protein ACE103_07715 [Bradyrhizobium sp. ma5]|uniref:hypothetical protein n=1 Tax=Bradyrhizobium sp. ma5 TaxID=3344828 RepID=UPI0035D44C6B
MKEYVGLDISQTETAVCVIGEIGQKSWSGPLARRCPPGQWSLPNGFKGREKLTSSRN